MSSASAIMALALASSCQMRETLALSETQFAGNMYSGPKLSARKDIAETGRKFTNETQRYPGAYSSHLRTE